MKTSSILKLSLAVLLFSQGCSKDDAGVQPEPTELAKDNSGTERVADEITRTGTLVEFEMVIAIYGKYFLKTVNSDGKEIITAIQTERNLDALLNKKVTIKGTQVDGFPLNGTDFIHISSIDEVK